MNTVKVFLRLLLPATALLVASCSSVKKNAAPDTAPAAASQTRGKSKAPAGKPGDKTASASTKDDLDEYSADEIADPLERMNRATFWCNDKMYLIVVRPISKGYEKVLPKFVRRGIDNAFDNARFPARFVNSALQGKFRRAGKETEKLLINTVAGLGGLFRVSDKIPSLANVPEEDTGQTFAVCGIGHGAYIVFPFFGPSSVREGIGLAGDYALNPINWGTFWHGNHDWTMAVQGANTVRLMPSSISAYDAATADAVDPYIAVRNAYIQNRAESVRK